MDSMPSVLQQQRMEVEQLRREASVKRLPVSRAIDDIKNFVSSTNQDDALLSGFHGKHQNPFREKSSCSVL